MGSSQCPECKIKYPSSFTHCRLHSTTKLIDVQGAPDIDWLQKVRNLQFNNPDQDTPELAPGASDRDWRLYQYLRLGVPREEAENLADRADVDWHDLERLLADGCDPELALRIVA